MKKATTIIHSTYKFIIQHSSFKIYMSFIILMLLSVNGSAQSTMENVLTEIKKNNKSIIASTQYWEAEKLNYKTGLTPANPTVEYDYLYGSPVNAGNQTEFSINQQFDFPTAYFKKNQLANEQSARAQFQLTATQQDILLEAKNACIQLVYHNKMQIQLSKQKKNTEKIVADFNKRLETGDGNILDVNKAKLQLLEINKAVQNNQSEINQLNQKLIELNGGNAIIFTDTVYNELPLIPPFEQLESDYESNDPLRKNLEQEKIIAEKKVSVSKSLSLPKIELGYHYQGFKGQNYKGIHTGISIPLWENKNTVKQKNAEQLFAGLELEAHINEHYYHIKHIYEKYANLKIILSDYQTVFTTLNSAALLNKALALGEITTLQYFLEINYYNQAYYNYLESEKEYFLTIAELYKYQL